MRNLTIFSHGDYSGLIFLAVLMLLAVAVGCLILIVASFRLTSKLGGSRSLIWGALLGVATVYIFPVSVL